MSPESSPLPRPKIAVIIPCFRVRDFIVDVVKSALETADYVFVIDDACPERSGDHLEQSLRDSRVRILRHEQNQGVGAAMVTGFQASLLTDAGIFVKMDGDGQMEPRWLPRLIEPQL
ncbi:MAG: glycosyltransferase, partial [Verrucomicrobiota bacterium]